MLKIITFLGALLARVRQFFLNQYAVTEREGRLQDG